MNTRITSNSIPVSKFAIHLCFVLFCLTCLIPLAAIMGISLSDQSDLTNFGYHIIPKTVSFSAYKYLLKYPEQILRGYLVSTFVTIIGAVSSLGVMSMLAYPLSRKDFKYNKTFSFMVFFTLLFNGGLVPWYILIVNYLHLKDSLAVLILPYLVVPIFVLILRTFFKNIPISLIEASRIDGAGEFKTFISIVLPLSKPVLAAVVLLSALQYWNDWFLTMLFIEKSSKFPLQYILYKTMNNIAFVTQNMSKSTTIDMSKFPTESARMAICVLAAGPMLFIFPFFQKYFAKGMTVGAVKE